MFSGSSTQQLTPRAEPRQPRQPVDPGRAAHLVGDEDVTDAAAREHFRLRDLLATHADRTADAELQLRHVDRLVHLAMHPEPHAHAPRLLAHPDDVAFERVEIENETGRLDVGLVHAGQGGHIIARLQPLGVFAIALMLVSLFMTPI